MPTCIICNNDKFTLVASRIREEMGQIKKCDICGLFIQDLDWDSGRLRKYYETEYQQTNSLVRNKAQTPLEHFNDRLETIRPLFEQIRYLLDRNSKVLEVGCGAGALLSLMKPHVKKCMGVELNTPFVEFIRDFLSIEAHAKDVNKLSIDDKFDLVICIATLDHLPNPDETLATMKRLLTPSGRIYVEVPNYYEALNHFIPLPNRLKYNEFFWHRAHLFYFTKETIAALFRKVGLKVKITSRHEYTLKNFLNWYFVGKPQSSFVTGCCDFTFFEGNSEFENQMNNMFRKMDKEFKEIMSNTYRGDNLCCLGEA